MCLSQRRIQELEKSLGEVEKAPQSVGVLNAQNEEMQRELRLKEEQVVCNPFCIVYAVIFSLSWFMVE